MKTKINQLKMSVVLTYLGVAFNILLSITYTPIMLKLLGQNEYGLYNTVSATISLLSLLNLGFGSSYIRYYSQYKIRNDQEGINRLNGMFLTIFSVIGAVALICGLILTNHLGLIFDNGLTEAEYGTARILMFLMTINLALSFPMSVFSNIINAHEKYVVLKGISLIKTVLTPIATLPLLFAGLKSIALVLVTISFNIIADILFIVFVLAKLKCRFSFKGFDKKLFYSLFGFTFFIAINLIIDQINWNVDKLILTRFKGTAEVAVYSVGYTIYTYYQMFSVSISSVFTPRIHKLVNETNDDNNKQKFVLTEIFVKVGRIQFLLLALIASGIVFFGEVFITKFWAGAEYKNSYIVAVLLVVSASIALIQNLGIEIQRAQNRHQFRSFVYLGMAIINLICSIFLCQKYGAIGSTIGTAISLILANGLIMNIYYQKKCNINVIEFWKNILRMLLGMLPAFIVGFLIMYFVEITNLLYFGLWVIIYIAVYFVSVWFLSSNRYEKNLLVTAFRKFKKN